MMIRNKKALGDFIVLIIVGLILFFLFALINIVARSSTDPDAVRFNEYYTKDLLRFLRTPASIISEDYSHINLAEYISIKFEEDLGQTFSHFSREFSEIFCAKYSGDNEGCYLGVASLSCLNEARTPEYRGISTESVDSREQRCIIYYPGGMQRLPITIHGYDVVSSVNFNGADMTQYELRMVVRK